MATTLISVEEYLKTAYEPDAEYVDGVIEERNLGEDSHADWQATLAYFFKLHRREWGIRVRSELRTRIGERRYRVPDVAILDKALPREPIATVAPLVAIEILSPEDRIPRLLIRLADFAGMGVPEICVIDPAGNSLRRYRDGKLEAADFIRLRDVVIPFADIIAELD